LQLCKEPLQMYLRTRFFLRSNASSSGASSMDTGFQEANHHKKRSRPVSYSGIA
ncbi:Hypothetical protein FKW44_024410, partial [Caligus rogercresseyi]